MSCIWHDFAYKSMRGYRNKTEKYNWLTRRYKRRNRHARYKCKKHKDFCALMDSLYGHCYSYTVAEIKHKLKPFLLWLKRHYELVLLPRDPDFRSGFETYGYIAEPDDDMTDEEAILYQLDYISDRWQCSFRVRWLINLLEPEYDYQINRNTH